MHYYQFNIADYQSHTKHLTPIEDICYRRLLDWQYLHEKPIPTDIKSVCRLLVLKDYQEDVEQILNEFFVLTEDGWINQHAFKEIQAYILQEENNQIREEGEKNRIRRHREEKKQLFADLRKVGVVPKWDILMGPLRELHKQHCNKPGTSRTDTCNAPVTEQERTCNAPAMAITINQEPINQEPITNNQTHTDYCSLNHRENENDSQILSDDPPTAEPEPPPVKPTPAASVCVAVKNQGIVNVNPAHPELLMLIEAGATVDEFVHAARTAKDKGKGFAYVIGIVKGQRKEALAASSQVLHGDLPNKSPPGKHGNYQKFNALDAINGGDGYGNKQAESGHGRIIDIGGEVAGEESKIQKLISN